MVWSRRPKNVPMMTVSKIHHRKRAVGVAGNGNHKIFRLFHQRQHAVRVVGVRAAALDDQRQALAALAPVEILEPDFPALTTPVVQPVNQCLQRLRVGGDLAHHRMLAIPRLIRSRSEPPEAFAWHAGHADWSPAYMS